MFDGKNNRILDSFSFRLAITAAVFAAWSGVGYVLLSLALGQPSGSNLDRRHIHTSAIRMGLGYRERSPVQRIRIKSGRRAIG